MKTYDIFVEKTGTERHTVSAKSFKQALANYHEGLSILKEDENDDVLSITILDRDTGEKINSESIPETSEPEPPFSFEVTIGANLRCYASLEVEAKSEEDARAKAMAILDSEGDHAASKWQWRRECVEGEISMQSNNQDTKQEGEFVDMEWSTGPSYSVLESIVRNTAALTSLESGASELNAIIDRAKACFPPATVPAV
jgi:hypothetical protein